MHGKIKTTQAKAKELKITAEKLITRAKSNTLANKKFLMQELAPHVAKKVIGEIAPRYSQRQGGYSRIVALGPRKSDGAKMAIIELVK